MYLTFLAVLGLHAIKDKPVVVNGKIEIRPVCRQHLITCVDMIANAKIDDVSRFDIRPPALGWPGGSYFPRQGALSNSDLIYVYIY